MGFTIISESIVERMMQYNVFKAKVLKIKIKDSNFVSYKKQIKLKTPCRNSTIFTNVSMDLYLKNFSFIKEIRSLGISVSNFEYQNQINFFENSGDLDQTIVNLRNKYGHDIINKANCLIDPKISNIFSLRDTIKKR